MMSPEFKQIVKFLIDDIEGHGYTNDPRDPGGPTKYGISLRWYRSKFNKLATAGDIIRLRYEDAERLYFLYWWQQVDGSMFSYEELPQRLASFLFILGINIGSRKAHEIVQKAYNRMTRNSLGVDGILGPNTLKAVRSVNEVELLSWCGLYAIRYYERINSETYEDGWLRRLCLSLINV